jgi:hypothetical protein
MKWNVLPVALLIRGTLAMGQSQAPEPQDSSSSANSTTSIKFQTTVGQRKEIQQDCIANGVQSGQLSTGETANLDFFELNRRITNAVI